MDIDAAAVTAETRAWVELAVVGLNLCPFAKAAQVKNQIRYVVSDAADDEALLATLCDEMQRLVDTPAAEVETTLLIHPGVLGDFGDFNDFLGVAEAAVDEMGLEGVLQVAAFHPDFQFGGTEADDITNATNRSPWPTLHLLREDSITRAVDSFPHPDSIYETNMRTMETLGVAGWLALRQRCKRDATG
ncbi:DUF1415 domain-containing protein [Rhizobacter sp. Root16D2]|uniref:DUF1415 domain-containing protein n=1 Tax=Rhizobacter sp. Root16D2 TaxID=1736479 RepID=UPI0006F2EACF|nr:DUF1415 domain-containing protein [Rhizobacter sp. Root16D2]KRB18242.1 hypothetical protein ASE08_24445 [Rhizobacter sp. Root16D2]